jgi:hypothetical protein
MTHIQPDNPDCSAPTDTTVYESWLAKDAARRALIAAEIGSFKNELFDTLEAYGIVLVTVDFDGCGDSGQIDSIIAIDEHGIVPLPQVHLARASVDPGIAPSASEGEPIADAIELLAYDLLESEHAGWEINEGAFGQFRFDAIDRTITLGCNIRIETSEFSQTDW